MICVAHTHPHTHTHTHAGNSLFNTQTEEGGRGRPAHTSGKSNKSLALTLERLGDEMTQATEIFIYVFCHLFLSLSHSLSLYLFVSFSLPVSLLHSLA